MYQSLLTGILVLVITTSLTSASSANQYWVLQENPDALDENTGTQDRPFKTICRALSLAQAGDTIVIGEGTYREAINMPKGESELPVTIAAAKGKDGKYEKVIINGADIISQWEQYQGDSLPDGAKVWMHKHWEHVWIGWNENMSHGADPPIGRAEQVIVDGKLLRPVLSISEMKGGTFFADPKASKALYIRVENDDSPENHLIEASVRDTLISASDYNHVHGLIFRYASNRAQQGALSISGKMALVEDCVVEWTNGSGIGINGENFILRRTTSHHNGQLGLGGSGKNFLIEECSFENNNVKGFSAGWEAGGFKIAWSWGAKIERCKAIGNHGPGMWFDIDNYGGQIRQCYCADNDNSGIFVEISGDFLITDNVCVNNGGIGNGDWAGAGISIGESRDCYIAFNDCVNNQYGITIRGQVPRPHRKITYKNRGITIRNNILAYNRNAQFGLMWDQSFMGRHPGEKELSDEEWQKRLQDAINPSEIGLILDYNLYAMNDKAQAIRWGVGWRAKSKAYSDLATFSEEQGLEAHGRTTDPLFISWQDRNFHLMPESSAIDKDGYINAGIRHPVIDMKADDHIY